MFIRLKIILIIMAIVTVIAATTLIASIYYMRSGLQEATENYISVIAEISEKLVSSETNLLKANAETVAEHLVNEPIENWGAAMRAQLAIHKNFMAFTVADRNGVVFAVGKTPTPSDLLKSEFARRAFAGETVISTTRADPTGELVFHVCVPFGSNGERILSVSIPGMLFCDLLGDLTIWETGSAYILDREGTIIASKRREWVRDRRNVFEYAEENPAARSLTDFSRVMLQGKKGIGRYTLFGVERLVAYISITGSKTKWVLAVVSPLGESPEAHITQGLILTALVFLSLGTLAAFLASGFIAKPILIVQEQNLHLAEMSAATREASEAKTRFLANMSHEMRTPLNAVIGFSELLIHSPPNRDELGEVLEKIHDAGMTLLSIVNDILDISKIESGRFELVVAEYDLASLINDAITLNIMRIGEKPIKFTLGIEETLPVRLRGDELRVKQIMNNLLNNAFKYTREGSVEFHVAAGREGDDVWLTTVIRDTGVGIREEDLPMLFDDYAQVDAKGNRWIEGTGLGLSISRRLVEMMGGQIRVESEYGKGSVFTARIRQQFVTCESIGAEVAENLRKFQYFRQKHAWKSDMVIHPLPYARVLLVDDVQANLEIGRGVLKPYGMKVDTAFSGRRAIELLRDENIRYHAVFMDHMMPDLDGIETVRIIRKIGTEYARTVPIIALTANAILGSRRMFLDNGFQDFISKPIDLPQLDAVLMRWVRNRDLETAAVRPPEEEDPPFRPVHEIGSIDGLDQKAALARFGGDRESFLRALRSYADTILRLVARAGGFDEKGLDAYAIMVHGIKSSSYGIGARQLGRLAENLESAARFGDFAFVRARQAELSAAAGKLLAELNERLNEVDRESGKPAREAPDPAVLDRLGRACRNYDMDGVDQA
ncbi:MAG: response regulator, partial [Planctomycetota bacterium]|nr:response regulator [Planctomycetota bacterium]